MSPTTAAANALDYMRPSPVRGQLDAYDPKAPEGWRYIQTTDTPGELRVLLPPATAGMYDQLLKLEAHELTKKSSIAWDRIMEIRHLKDRMIRKCQRLAKDTSPTSRRVSRGDPFIFQTVIAPSDFRLKEMEKWFRDQQKRLPPTTSAPRASTSRADPQATAQKRASSSRAPQVHRSSTHAPAPSPLKEKPSQAPSSKAKHRAERNLSLPASIAKRVSTIEPTLVLSPIPLPILLLSQREEYGLECPPDPPSEKPIHLLPGSELGTVLESIAKPQDTAAGPSDGSSGDKTPEESGQEDAAGKPPLRRRRSCIRRNSTGELVKTVSWADAPPDLDKQLAQYADFAKYASETGAWSEIRGLYTDQIQGLSSFHDQVKEGLERLREETDHLQRIDNTIQHQRESLEKSFKDFEDRYSLFQAKVQEALTGAATGNLTRNNANANVTSTTTTTSAKLRPLGLPPIVERSFEN